MQGLLITLEGPEGSGKSTLLNALKPWLAELGVPVLYTREPGGTVLGSEIRTWLLHGQALAPWTELLLFLADRAQHISEVICPALAEGCLVLCDRFMDSTTAYQHAGRGFGFELIQSLHGYTLDGLRPALTLLLDVDSELGLRRAATSGKTTAHDKFENLDLAFHQRVRAAFLRIAAEEPARVKCVDTGQLAPAEVLEKAKALILPHLHPWLGRATSIR